MKIAVGCGFSSFAHARRLIPFFDTFSRNRFRYEQIFFLFFNTVHVFCHIWRTIKPPFCMRVLRVCRRGFMFPAGGRERLQLLLFVFNNALPLRVSPNHHQVVTGSLVKLLFFCTVLSEDTGVTLASVLTMQQH